LLAQYLKSTPKHSNAMCDGRTAMKNKQHQQIAAKPYLRWVGFRAGPLAMQVLMRVQVF
jgi:hypothetical protein